MAGTRLRDIAPNVGTAEDTEDWEKVHKDVINRCAVSPHGLRINDMLPLPMAVRGQGTVYRGSSKGDRGATPPPLQSEVCPLLVFPK